MRVGAGRRRSIRDSQAQMTSNTVCRLRDFGRINPNRIFSSQAPPYRWDYRDKLLVHRVAHEGEDDDEGHVHRGVGDALGGRRLPIIRGLAWLL